MSLAQYCDGPDCTANQKINSEQANHELADDH